MSADALDPEIVKQTDAWFYLSHPRGRELRGKPLSPTSLKDADGRKAWTGEYRKRLAEKQFLASTQLANPRIIAIATDGYLTGSNILNSIIDPYIPETPKLHKLGFGQDLSYSSSRPQPSGVSMGDNAGDLEQMMRRLLIIFAGCDKHGMAKSLFDFFLMKQTNWMYWGNSDLDAAVKAHQNIRSFVSMSLSAPNSPERSTGKIRIHQALQNAGWDINRAVTVTDLGVPALNRGNKLFSTGDFCNGLGVMINGIQHVVVVAKSYVYKPEAKEYTIKLEYRCYDVFGLDDDDLREYGASSKYFSSMAAQGITAWWQLQHQHGYVPVITRAVFEQVFTAPAS